MKITNLEALIMEFSPALVTSSVFGRGTLVSLVFLNAVSLCEKLKTVCCICIDSSLITFCVSKIQLRRLRYVSFALHSKN
jgi:hypothetical protein